MAEKLFIAMNTLYIYLSRIHKKLGVRNSRELLHLLRKRPEHAMSTLRFTPRGREVFALIVEGASSKEISERLGMGINGVKRHKDKMLWQNNCDTMRELIAKYRRAVSESLEAGESPN